MRFRGAWSRVSRRGDCPSLSPYFHPRRRFPPSHAGMTAWLPDEDLGIPLFSREIREIVWGEGSNNIDYCWKGELRDVRGWDYFFIILPWE